MTNKQSQRKHSEQDANLLASTAPATPPAATDEVQGVATSAFPIVGIGASAGGLAAFQAFFSGMPANTEPGMAFVLVQHLDPNHESILAELIRRYTRMPVFDAVDGVVVKVNCVYIITPNHDMAILNGALQLLNPSMPRGHRLPIDYFFRSLAQDQRENAVAIVLSGTGSDGALGVRAIKGEGGMVMAQTPVSTEFDGMPESAIATGVVDYQLPPADMAVRLIAYAALASKALRLPVPTVVAQALENELKKVFVVLRAQTGHDFSLYKSSTLIRRIERRMALLQIEMIEGYVTFLQRSPVEVDALFRDLLIGVTSFFRDREAFDKLDEQLATRLLAGKQAGEKVRVWSCACSTGEEAYSIAILLYERMQALKQNYAVQIFATDIDSQAIATARAGLYPTSIAADLTRERLAQFFILEPGSGYRVRKVIRDMITFSEQDVIRDPPFSQLDLISCRNLLIYLRGELQAKLMQLFHYALNPGGMLFLGNSEGAVEVDNLFAVLGGKARLFHRREVMPLEALGNFLPPMKGPGAALMPHNGKQADLTRLSLGQQTEQALLQLLAPACALVEGNGDILHLRGRTGMYLEPAQGDAGIYNILKMAREGLAQDLRLALYQAVQNKGVVRRDGLRVRTNGAFTMVNLIVCPVLPGIVEVQPSFRYLVVLEDAPVIEAEPVLIAATTESAVPVDARIAALEQELRTKEKLLRAAIEDADTSTEELSSAIEEMQSINEELLASNEELATSKEELQSMNEELATVNVEQQNKVVELARALNDNRNLLSGSGIATVFVDLQQRILSFTPAATAIIKLVAGDVGRPLGHFMASLRNYDQLTEDIAFVLDTLVAKEIKVQDKLGRWYMLRILPYRTVENVIEGAAISFVDISEVVNAQVDIADLKKVQAALKESELRYRSVVSALSEAVILHARDGRIVACNPATERIFGLPCNELQELGTFDPLWRTIREDGSPFPRETCPSEEAFRTGLTQKDVVMGIYRPDGALVWISSNAVPIFEPGDALPALVVVSCIDITKRKRTGVALSQARDYRLLATVLRDAHDAITLQELDGRMLVWNQAAQRIYGWTEADALQMNLLDRVPPELRADELERLAKLSLAQTLAPYCSQRLAKDGSVLEVWITATALRNEAAAVYAVATTERLIQGGSDGWAGQDQRQVRTRRGADLNADAA